MDNLKLFLEIAEAGGIRKAADRINMAASALSRHIAQLEKNLGSQLFDRRGRGMYLTPAGRLYLEYARDVASGEARVRAELSALSGLRKGHIRIYSAEGYAADLVTRIIARFREKHPGITFDLMISGADGISLAVQQGKADIGLAFMAEPLAGVESAISIRAPLLAIMAPHYPLATRSRISLSEALKHPLALPGRGFGIRRLLDSICRLDKLDIKPIVTTNSISAMKAFAQHGAGITLLSRLSVSHETALGQLVGIPFNEPAMNKTTVEAWVLSRRRLPSAVSVFLKALRQEMTKASAGSQR